MGQQQLLIILLGIILVGVALYVGLGLFHANAVESKRGLLTNELVNLASMAQQYYLKPTTLAGGGRDFSGWTIPSQLVETSAGYYRCTVNPDNVIIIGTGNEVVTGNDSVKVKITVTPFTYQVVIIK